ncbi:MAG: signal peptide peptidase SppA [Crocinitomicaceae bacterium]|nr:signal peptide peptidase SppA [Crocinitomicaceae bacterium]
MTFWKTFWASVLGFVASGVILMIVFFTILNFMISGFSKPVTLQVEDDTVLHLTLDKSIGDYTAANFNASSFSFQEQVGLYDLIEGLKIAEEDDKIKGIFMNTSGVPAGYATTKELRDALAKFQASGKFIMSYSDNYSVKGYYLSSVADELYVHPAGMLEFLGIGGELMFFKNALEKLDVEVQIIRGSNNKFKSAVEPFMYEQMSDANREQTMKYLNSIWGQMLDDIGEKRGLTPDKLNEIADSVYVRNSDDAIEYKMADGALFYDEVLLKLAAKVGTSDPDSLNFMSFTKYCMRKTKEERVLAKLDNKNMALIFAEGEIVDGYGEAGQIGGDRFAEYVREARMDENIKAVVLRVNSPGGSALASDHIWREVLLTKEQKPVIVSMGDVAASGGYYISCGADKIYAQPNTITGSIGVFGMIPYTGKMFEEKLGITFSHVQTNKHSLLSFNKKLTEEEMGIFQEGVDEIYDDFITKVSEGRGISKAMVDSIGQGRVWAGTDALEIGLIDEYGSMDDAINYAAEMANIGLDTLRIKTLPASKGNEFMEFIEMIEEQDAMASIETSAIEEKFNEIYGAVKMLGNRATYQARLPYLIWIE